jgi:hypothetical protein
VGLPAELRWGHVDASSFSLFSFFFYSFFFGGGGILLPYSANSVVTLGRLLF